MQQVSVVVEHVDDIPAGLPAVWTESHGPAGKTVHLLLRADLPTPIEDKFRAMATRDAMPEVDFDAFTVTSTAVPVMAVA